MREMNSECFWKITGCMYTIYLTVLKFGLCEQPVCALCHVLIIILYIAGNVPIESVLTLQVVPTIYTDIRGRTVHSNQVLQKKYKDYDDLFISSCPEVAWMFCQYSVTEHFTKSESMRLDSLPGVYFIYDFSPIKVCSFLHIQ